LEEGRAAQYDLPLGCGKFLVLREDGVPAETTRLEPCPPGGFWQGNGPQRDLFFLTAPRGAPEKVRAEMAFLRKEPSLLPFLEGRKHIIGTGVRIVFSSPAKFFPRGPFRGTNDADCGSLVQPASLRDGARPARKPLEKSWSSGHQFLGGDQREVSILSRRFSKGTM
jgi:hypothetical protein